MLPGLTAKSHQQVQLGVDGLEVANDAPRGGLASAHAEFFASRCIGSHLRFTTADASQFNEHQGVVTVSAGE
jgi:hypothetical protein